MGADMIGYTVFGPIKIKLGSRQKKRIASKMQEILDILDDLDSSDDANLLVIEKYRLNEDDLLSCSMPDGIETPEAFVDAFISFWNNESGRDVAARHLPKSVDPDVKWKVLFAGDMSWGDTPTGYGFHMFDTMNAFNLWDDFGVC